MYTFLCIIICMYILHIFICMYFVYVTATVCIMKIHIYIYMCPSPGETLPVSLFLYK